MSHPVAPSPLLSSVSFLSLTQNQPSVREFREGGCRELLSRLVARLRWGGLHREEVDDGRELLSIFVVAQSKSDGRRVRFERGRVVGFCLRVRGREFR